MTVGAQTYQSIVDQYPILRDLIPDQIVREIDSARMMVQFAATSERNAFDVANKAIAAHNAGILTSSDYANYDLFRHKVYDTQVAWLRSIRAFLYELPGGSVVANQLPWPQWLKPLRPETPHNVVPMVYVGSVSTGSGVSGLGAFGGDDFIAVAGIIAGAVLIGYLAQLTVDKITSAWRQWVLVSGQTSAMNTSVTARRDAFNACVRAGTDAATCQRTVTGAIPAPSQQAIDNFMNRTEQDSDGHGAVWYLGLFTAIGVGVYVLYLFNKPASRGTSGVRGFGAAHG